MGKIKVLDEKTRLKIAAGEVVQNPASVVKELLENSIDAESSRIEINIQKGGKRLIEVIDNGIGMSPDDAEIAFQRYSTSKITDISDLETIHSLGFRGEALASIAAVAQVELITKPNGAPIGTRILVKENNVIKIEESERVVGTTLRIQNLFFNLPARLKFLKTSTAEFQSILNIVTNYSLQYKSIHFILRHDNTEILNSPAVSDKIDKIFYIYGKDIAKNMISVNFSTELLKISGYISKPIVQRGTRKFYSIFINDRLVKGKLITDAIDYAYKNLLPKNRYPVIVLSINIDPAMVDVNIHPTKQEVKFSQEQFIVETLQKVILEAFDRENLIPKVKIQANQQTQLKLQKKEASIPKLKPIQMKLSQKPEIFSSPEVIESVPRSEATPEILSKGEIEEKIDTISHPDSKQKLPSIEIIGQTHNLFIIAADEENLYIIDQHAAHERIMFEKFLNKLEKSPIQTQTLLSPITIEIPITDLQILQSKLQLLIQFGFNIEPFGKTTYRINQLPIFLGKSIKKEDIQLLIDELLVLIDPNSKKIPSRVEIAQLYACKAAIKAGTKLSHSQMEQLYRELQRTENPYVCAHNRPSIIIFPKSELAQKFHR